MAVIGRFYLSFRGNDADFNVVDFYDAAEAITGFQRSLALTSHLILNGEVITQAPSLRNAKIYVLPPEKGSWKIGVAIVSVATALSQINSVPRETPLGNLIYSAYDFVISETLGFHVDYSKTLKLQYEEYKKAHPDAPQLNESKLDSVIEKCEPSIRQMHRPIIKTETAKRAIIEYVGADRVEIPELTEETFEYISYTATSDYPVLITGRISSYNINTFKGRVFSFEEQRPISFVLADHARNRRSVAMITKSLTANAVSRLSGEGDITMAAFVNTSRTGIVKSYFIVSVESIT